MKYDLYTIEQVIGPLCENDKTKLNLVQFQQQDNESHMMTFGKYNGIKTVQEVFEDDLNYCKWVWSMMERENKYTELHSEFRRLLE